MEENLWKIREMYLSDNQEDKTLAFQWLCQLIGQKDANANLFILTFYKNWDDDSDCTVDGGNWWAMRFETYPISFGKDYRYRVRMIAKFGGEEILDTTMDYGRFAVGNGQPKFDFCDLLCQALRKSGYVFHQSLFARGAVLNSKTLTE